MKICNLILAFLAACTMCLSQTVIRYNQLGYTTQSPKVLVLASKTASFKLKHYALLNVITGKIVHQKTSSEKDYGAYGPFLHSYRINISSIKQPGFYRLVANDTIRSGIIRIGDNVYNGTADFCLRYMRQQRSGFNPFLKDSCHMYDGYSIYGEAAGIPDGTHVDVSGGWHDASDYLQYTTTSANAAYHLLMAYRDYPNAFTDHKRANGLDGKNGLPDVLDEAKWGLDWLLKMHPKPEWMFAQLGDDRDHISMRIPKLDSQYGKGFERPVYFLTGEPQGLGKYKNKTEGTTSVAAKFCSAFALGAQQWQSIDSNYAKVLLGKSWTAFDYAHKKMGFTNTAPNRAPYYYAEQNWYDDDELAYASLYQALQKQNAKSTNKLPGHFFAAKFSSMLDTAFERAQQERHTPWLGADTAMHYQWYPFINIGHRELANIGLQKDYRDSLILFYKQGIENVWTKAKQNAFYRSVPFIWCSNNLTVSFAMQCMWYRHLSGDAQFRELEQANINWLFGTNPWGTSMVYGLPAWGDTPTDPHSAFTHLKNYPIDGGLVDGPVYTSIFKNLIGLTLFQPDEYAEWQSDLAVYHDDYGDYSTNEPTMDGTASLIYLLAAQQPNSTCKNRTAYDPVAEPNASATLAHGAIVRGDSTKKQFTLVFTGHEFSEGGDFILKTLKQEKIKAAFFLTGDFVRKYPELMKQVVADGHYVGPHSNKHLLCCDWTNRDSLLVTKEVFQKDLLDNFKALKQFGITPSNAPFFLPAYEWYNAAIAAWANEMGITLINNTTGTLSAADYTTPDDANYRSNQTIEQSIIQKAKQPGGLNGYLLLMHVGAGDRRKEKFFMQLPSILQALKHEGYKAVGITELLK